MNRFADPEGPSASPFPSTAWSVIRRAQDGSSPERRRALERLVSVYWRPVYWSARLDWRLGAEDARDATQGYFSLFLEHDLLREVSSDRGHFRTFVKATLDNYMIGERRRDGAWKRGGRAGLVPLSELEEAENEPPSHDASPERRFERELLRAILRRALADLETSCDRDGRPCDFALFREFYAAGGAAYEDLRSVHALGAHDVKNRLATLRVRFRKIVLGYLRDGVSSEEEILSEVREVFGP